MRTISSLARMLVLAAGLSLVGTFSVTGCSGESAEVSEIGTLSLPLQTTVNGELYGLEGTLRLAGGPELIIESVHRSDPRTEVVLTPRVGNYQLELDSWSLYRFENGVPMLVNGAELVSPNPQPVQIQQNQPAFVTLQFNVPGRGRIVFARGSLTIDYEVTEGYPAGHTCTTSEECASHICESGVCTVASCSDGVLNGDEFGPDCGGSCATACACTSNADCATGETCVNGVCDPAGACMSDADCATGETCVNGVCG